MTVLTSCKIKYLSLKILSRNIQSTTNRKINAFNDNNTQPNLERSWTYQWLHTNTKYAWKQVQTQSTSQMGGAPRRLLVSTFVELLKIALHFLVQNRIHKVPKTKRRMKITDETITTGKSGGQLVRWTLRSGTTALWSVDQLDGWTLGGLCGGPWFKQWL